MTDFGNQSLRLLCAQSSNLTNGDLVRVKQSSGEWTVLKIFSRHKRNWYNVSNHQHDSPSHSLKLIPGGRWYIVSNPWERKDELEVAELNTPPPGTTTLPVEEEKILEIQGSHPSHPLTEDDTDALQFQSSQPSILPLKSNGSLKTQLEMHQDVDNEGTFNLDGYPTGLGFNYKTADFIAQQFVTLIGIEDVANQIKAISDWQRQATIQSRPSYEDQLRFSTIGRDLLEEFQKSCRAIALQNPASHKDLTEVKFIINKIVSELLDKPHPSQLCGVNPTDDPTDGTPPAELRAIVPSDLELRDMEISPEQNLPDTPQSAESDIRHNSYFVGGNHPPDLMSTPVPLGVNLPTLGLPPPTGENTEDIQSTPKRIVSTNQPRKEPVMRLDQVCNNEIEKINMMDQRIRWDNVIKQLRNQKQTEQDMINHLRIQHEQGMSELRNMIGGIKMRTTVEQQDIRSELAPLGSKIADMNKHLQVQDARYNNLTLQVGSLTTTTKEIQDSIQSSNQLECNWKMRFEREFHANLATLVDGISNLRKTIETTQKVGNELIRDNQNDTVESDLVINKNPITDINIQDLIGQPERVQSPTSQLIMDPVIETCIEELDEFNERVTFLHTQCQKALDSEHDGHIKEMHTSLNHRIDKLHNNAQQIRKNYKQAVRTRLSPEEASAALRHESFRTNMQLMRGLDALTSNLSEQVNVRGLSLPPSALAKSVVKEFTTFCGTALPLVHEFLEESKQAMIHSGVPLAHRGIGLKNSLRGPAKIIVSNSDLPRNPSFDEVSKVLRTHFGQVGFLTNLLQRLHKEHGPIPPPYAPEQSVFEVFNITKEHMRLIKAAEYLQDLFLNGKIPENVVNSPYLNLLEEQLPGEQQCRLSEMPRYNTTMSTTERFNVLLETYAKLSDFASAKIAKFGIKEDPKSTKKKRPTVPALTTIPPEIKGRDQTPKLLRFQEKVPVVNLPLPDPKPRSSSSTVVCFKCNETGHIANVCPTHRMVNNDQRTRPPYRQTLQYFPHDSPDHMIGKTTCYVCTKLSEFYGRHIVPTDHIFLKKSGRLHRASCPMLTILPTIEERENELTKARICLTCLSGQIDDDNHKHQACERGSKYVGLKCVSRECLSRYDICGKHVKENKVRLQFLKNTLPKLAPNVPSLITSLAQPTPFCNQNPQQVLCSGPESKTQLSLPELIRVSKPPIMKAPETPAHFLIQLITPKVVGEEPALCVFDSGSLSTLATQKTISSKLHSSPMKEEGSNIQGLGGTMVATPHFLSLPLDPVEASGHSSRITPCLAVKRIINIQPPDTKEIEHYLKHNYGHLLPEDFSLYNFGSLGNMIEIDILLGVTDLAIYPKLLFSTSCGLHVYKSPLLPAPGTSPYLIAGNLPPDAKVRFARDNLRQEVACASLHIKFNMSDPDFLEDIKLSKEQTGISKEPPRKEVPNQKDQAQLNQNIICISAKENQTRKSDMTPETQLSNLLEVDVQTYRCLSCQLCKKCSQGSSQVGNPMSLKQEVENELVRNSVTLDLESCRLIAKLILPANYSELLGDNKDQCLTRLRRQLRKLSKRDKDEQAQVKESIDKLIKRGFVCLKENLSPTEIAIVEKHQTAYYLPTAIVFKSSSISSPSRVCLDASAKGPLGFSLNDLLPKGMCSIRVGALIHHWKSLPIAISGDLSSYYCRFGLTPEYWPVQKFLWIPSLDPEGKAEEFYVKTIIYGVKTSSLICEFGLRKLVDAFPHLQKLTIYVDDVTGGYFDLTMAEESAREIAKTLDRYGLPLKGGEFAITGKEAPKEILDTEGNIGISCVKWNPLRDTFTCNIPSLYMGQSERGSLANVEICPYETPEEINQWLPNTFNLRDLLSKTASHFDGQLGLVASLTTKLRKLVREVSAMSRNENGETDWTYVIPPKERMIFCNQVAELKALGKFEYSRFPRNGKDILTEGEVYLLCFTDSGEFETIVIYLAYQLKDGSLLFNYLTAASYLKTESETVPRSELNACARGASIVRDIIEDVKGKIKLVPYLFTDSLVAVHWMVNHDSFLHIFQRNRVAAVLSVFGSNIYHVKSDHNLADITSRDFTTANDISPSSKFYNGPEWLDKGLIPAIESNIITPASSLAKDTDLTPDLLNAFRSGVILSKYVDHNFVRLKKQIERRSKNESPNQIEEPDRCTENHIEIPKDDNTQAKSQPAETAALCADSQSTQPSILIQQANALITAANLTLQTTDCGPDLSGKATQQLKGMRDRQHTREQIPYFLDPSSKPFPRLCRVGALVLKFIYMLLKKTLGVSKPDKFEMLNHRIFMDPPLGWDPPWSFVYNCKKQLNNNDSLTTSLAVVKPTEASLDKWEVLTLPLINIRKKWYRYPGMNRAINTILKQAENDKVKERRLCDKEEKELETLASLLSAWQHQHARSSVQEVARSIAEIAQQILSPITGRTFQTHIKPQAKSLGKISKMIPDIPNQHSFISLFKNHQDEAPKLAVQAFLHLIRAEQQCLETLWGRDTLRRRGIWRHGYWLNNTRWRDSVGRASGVFSKEPGTADFSSFIKTLFVPLLDGQNPLYKSLSHFIHHHFMLPNEARKTLQSKHRGISQDLMMALRFAYAPYATKTFKRLRDECMTCQLRIKRLMRTQEGNLHITRLTHIKPFNDVHIDLAGPIYLRTHLSTATRRTPNRTKAWILVVVCSWTRAVQAELIIGTSASDVADGLTRVMLMVGSITHIITDQLAAQLKIVKEAKFFEQVQNCLHQRIGFQSTIIPVSRHNFNGSVEVRIRSLKQMLALRENQTELNLIEFSTQIKIATNLINAIPYAYSLKGAEQHPQLQLISPSCFLYPLRQLHKPILGPILLERSPQHYFKAMKDYYESMITTYIENIVPAISAKHHNYNEVNDPNLKINDLVLFKKRPGNSLLPGWSLGRVTETKVSKDGVVRAVQLIYALNTKKEGGSDPLTEVIPTSMVRYDKNLYKIYTTRQVDELIKLFPLPNEESEPCNN